MQKKKILYFFFAAVFFLLVLLQQACSSGPVITSESGNPGIDKSYTQSHATLVQRADKSAITVADQLQLVLETSVPENTDVGFPSYSASLGDFTLVDTTVLPVRMTGTGSNIRIIHKVIYLLEPYLPGTYTIPPMTISYVTKGESDVSDQIVTDEIQIAVGSLLQKEGTDVTIKDIRGPLSLPENSGLKALLILILVGLGGLAAALVYHQKSRGGIRKPEVQLRADEIALQELDTLLADDLLAQGEVKLFHLRISDILRHYIENRFGLKAPERTTEEFLTEISRTGLQKDPLLGSHKTLLAGFLIHCDLVKFAKHEPTKNECETTVSLCREFIEKTKEENIEESSRQEK